MIHYDIVSIVRFSQLFLKCRIKINLKFNNEVLNLIKRKILRNDQIKSIGLISFSHLTHQMGYQRFPRKRKQNHVTGYIQPVSAEHTQMHGISYPLFCECW